MVMNRNSLSFKKLDQTQVAFEYAQKKNFGHFHPGIKTSKSSSECSHRPKPFCRVRQNIAWLEPCLSCLLRQSCFNCTYFFSSDWFINLDNCLEILRLRSKRKYTGRHKVHIPLARKRCLFFGSKRPWYQHYQTYSATQHISNFDWKP